MGLAEKRAIAAYQEKDFPRVKKEIEAAAGFPVEMDVRWDSLAEPGQGARYSELFEKVYFKPLIDAFKAVASDEMGKKALKEALKKVVVDGSSGYGTSGFSFEGGILKLQHEPSTNVDDVQLRADGIQKLIEEKL
jgi:hypothetical protein